MDKRSKLMIIAIIVMVVAIIGLVTYIVISKNKTEMIPSGPEIDESNAVLIEDNENNDIESNKFENGVSISFVKTITIDSSTGKAELLFALPNSNDLDSVISIIINGETIIRSGRIKSGYQVNELNLLYPNKSIKKSSYDGTLMISFYAKESNTEASVSTEIPVTVIVK